MSGNDDFFSKDGMTANVFNNRAEYANAAEKDVSYTPDFSVDNARPDLGPPRMALMLRSDGTPVPVIVPGESLYAGSKTPEPPPPGSFSRNRL